MLKNKYDNIYIYIYIYVAIDDGVIKVDDFGKVVETFKIYKFRDRIASFDIDEDENFYISNEFRSGDVAENSIDIISKTGENLFSIMSFNTKCIININNKDNSGFYILENDCNLTKYKL